MLLTVHLQVCKALLQVAEGPGEDGVRGEWGWLAMGPGWGGSSPCQGLALKVAGSMVRGVRDLPLESRWD